MSGAILGGLLGLRTRPRQPLLVAPLGMLAQAPLLWLLAATAPVVAIAVAALVGGIAFAYFSSVWETTVQRAIPTDVVSRVSAYDWLGSLAFYPLGQALAAPVAAAIGLHLALWLAGAWAAISTLALLASPAVRTIDRLHTRDPAATDLTPLEACGGQNPNTQLVELVLRWRRLTAIDA